MRILGIESSSLVASAAIYEDGITMAEYTVDFKMTHSQTLLPMIDEMVKLVGIDLNTIDAIAVSGGPHFLHFLQRPSGIFGSFFE